MLIGLDFDNTLVRYDLLFHQIAIERGLIDFSVAKDKTAVRDYLRATGQEDAWTVMQGEVYGSRILDAVPATGMLTALGTIQRRGLDLCIVSHKTKFPYMGEPVNLHHAAEGWLESKGFFNESGLNWCRDNVHFAETKEDKIAKILELGCTHYVDDLPEILEMLPERIHKYLYDPGGNHSSSGGWTRLPRWRDLNDLVF